jgi:hypothetical protein
MSRWTTRLGTKLIPAAAAVAVLAGISLLRAADGEGDSWDEYRLLIDRNIFLRYRRRPTTRAPAPRPVTRGPRDSDYDIVLTGVGRHDGEYVAFFEDTASEVTGRIRVGEAVGRGKVRAITLDAVDYERDGSVRRIEIGYALRGGRFVREAPTVAPPPATQPSEPASPTTGPATAPAEPAREPRATPRPSGAGDSDIADILKKMRERREKELRR